ncbi:MAG: hypothetical protein ACYTEE_09920, partial [Planctomycetota bacterium]
AWLHVLIDSIYHYDVNLFWPHRAKPLYNLLSQQQVKWVCLAFWCAAIILYIIIITLAMKQRQKPLKK